MHINETNTRIIPLPFEYHAPTNIEAAVELLLRYDHEAYLLAGGTDLLVKMKRRLVEPRHVINIKGLSELNGIEEEPDGVRIGAATRLRAVERSMVVEARLPLLHEAVKSIGSVQVRNMATIGGNLCNASPAADSATALLVLDAEAHITGPQGARTVPLEGFFVGPSQTDLRRGEVLTGVSSPYLPEGSGTSFIKVRRTSFDIATISVAVVLRLRRGVVDGCRIAFGAVAPTPIRVRRAEEVVRGRELEGEVLEGAAEAVSRSIRPITDIRGTAEYRREVSKTLTKDALKAAADRAWRR